MIRKTTLLLAALAALLPFAANAADEAELDALRLKVMAMFDGLVAEDIQPSPVDGWYSVHKGPILAYISADGRYLLQGDMIDLEQQVNLSEEARTGMRRDLLAQIGEDEFITFSPTEVKYSVAIFTDVDCTYCRKLHAEIDEYLANGIEVKYLLYPRNGPASRSWNTAEEIVCAKDRNYALTMAKLDKSFSTSQCDSPQVSNNYVVGRDVGLSGTPAIIFDDGTMVGGYLPPAALLQRLESNAARRQ